MNLTKKHMVLVLFNPLQGSVRSKAALNSNFHVGLRDCGLQANREPANVRRLAALGLAVGSRLIFTEV